MRINKKIRILTFHSAYSYGAVLQTFALWKFLDERYSDVKVVDYRPSTFTLQPIWNEPLTWIKTIQFRFRNQIKTTKKYTAELLRKQPPESDVFIIGSDQVWNPVIIQDDLDIYFGDFIPKKQRKISYSSSFGREKLSIEEKIRIKKVFHDFNAISVREQTGVSLCKDIINQDAKCVVDPTFLIDDYSKYFKLGVKKQELCLFVLDNDSNECFNAAIAIAKRRHLKPKVLNKNRPINGIKNIPMPTIPRFLREISTSEFILTNSFHGLAYSIIFQKDFIFVCTNKSNSTRPYNLLQRLELTERFVESFEEAVRSSLIMESIDYSIVNSKNSQYIQESIDYLLNSIDLE